MSLLPFPRAERIDPLDALAARARRLADVVEAVSRRRDVRELRAQILLLLLAMRCPPGVRPIRTWYVPGAVARVGARGLVRAWRTYWGEDPPSERTVRRHLGALEQAGAIVRAPGDWLPTPRADIDARGWRYPDTVHLLCEEWAAQWWAREGWARLEEHPEARRNPSRWRELIGDWRARARAQQGELFPDLVAQLSADRTTAEASEEPRRDRAKPMARDLADLVVRRAGSLELLSCAARVGVHVRGANAYSLARDPVRLRGATAILVLALEAWASGRGPRIRRPAGYLVRAYRHATARELEFAQRSLLRALAVARGSP